MVRMLLAISLGVLVAGCGSNVGFGDDGGGDGYADVTTPIDSNLGFDGGSAEATPCVGLQCQQTCPSTTISGTVYDPAGINGLYNVYVYVPNAPLDPITDGPVCTQCQATASGSPVVAATTDATGKFTIPNAPVGANIPVVLQIGKWRRHLTVSNVAACVDNPQPDKSLRLPRIQHESSPDDNIPLIAMTNGCDAAECFFLRRIGIDQSEFTDATGTGRVRLYLGYYGSKFTGVTSTASTLWTTPGEMMKYDIVFDACQCYPLDRGGAGTTDIGYKNYLAYLNAGGRAFATHYFYNFFTSPAQCGVAPAYSNCQGQSPLPTVGAWLSNQSLAYAPQTNCPTTSADSCLNIDTGVPKGKALADWYKNNNAKIGPTWGPDAYGYVGLADIRNDMGALDPALVTAGTATPWLYAPGPYTFPKNYDAYYFSINTPVGTNPATQCGRAIFSDVHLAGVPSGTFPSYCEADPNTSDHAPNQLALEFLFFDLSSCVQDDTKPPLPPPN